MSINEVDRESNIFPIKINGVSKLSFCYNIRKLFLKLYLFILSKFTFLSFFLLANSYTFIV